MGSSIMERLALEAASGPFVLELDDGSCVAVKRPSPTRLLALASASTHSERLTLLADMDALKIVAAIGGEDAAVMSAVIDDLAQAFGAEGVSRFSWLLDRYSEAIERDLSFFHETDLLDVLRGKVSIRKALAYIDRLPSWSAFAEASAQDDEVAAMYVEREDDGERVAPRIIEWTPERAQLVQVTDLLNTLISMVGKALGGKGDQPEPQPRPVTALDRAAARFEAASYDYLMTALDRARTASSE